MDIDMIDVTLRLNDSIGADQAEQLQASLHDLDGVISTHIDQAKRHVLLAEINPKLIDGAQVLAHVEGHGISAEMVVPDRL